MQMELEQIERQVSDVDKKVNNVDTQMKDVDKKVSSILQLLKGNELDRNDNGFVGEVNDLRTRVEKLEDLKKKVIYIGIGVSFPTSYGLASLIAQFIKSLH